MSLVRPPLPDRAARILAKARSDREAAKESLAALSVDEQVALLCETPVSKRAALLSLVAAPEQVIPRIPEAELCFIVKAIGPADAGWVMEHASSEQMVACLDLDAWSGTRFSPERFREWWLAAADAGPETLVRWFHALDPETLIMALHDRIDVALQPADATEREDWVPPAGSQTLEGNFYYRARHEGDDLAELTMLLKCLFEANYWDYFRVMHGPLQELPIETEEWAMRWRRGRLEDQGFPPREEAVALFARIEPEDRATLPDEKPALDVEGFQLPVWAPRILVVPDAQHALLAAAARLPEDERAAFLQRLFSVANKVAVAYGLPLSDVESVPTAIEDAIVLASRGLEELSRANSLAGDAVLRRVPLEHLFRVGASFHPERAARVLAVTDAEDGEDEAEADEPS